MGILNHDKRNCRAILKIMYNIWCKLVKCIADFIAEYDFINSILYFYEVREITAKIRVRCAMPFLNITNILYITVESIYANIIFQLSILKLFKTFVRARKVNFCFGYKINSGVDCILCFWKQHFDNDNRICDLSKYSPELSFFQRN